MIRPFENIFPDETYEVLEKGAKLPVGTIRTWNNREYIKVSDNKWVLKKDIQLRLSTRDRFFDKKQVNGPRKDRNCIKVL